MCMERLTQPFFDPFPSRRKPISLISHSDVRYRGILAGIDPHASTIQLSNGEFIRLYPKFKWRSLVLLSRPGAEFFLSRVKCTLWEPRRDGTPVTRFNDRVDIPFTI